MHPTAISMIATLALVTTPCLGAGKLSLKDLTRYEGVWESNPRQDGEATVLGYNEHRILADYAVKQQLHIDVDQKTHEILNAYIGFLTLHSSGEEFYGFAFSSDDWSNETITVPTKRGFATQVIYTGTNGQHLALLTLDEFVSDGEMRGVQKNSIGGGQFTEEGSVSIRKKTHYASLHDLIAKSGIRSEKWESRTPPAMLQPLKPLLGHWQSKNVQGQPRLDCVFEYRGGKHWVVERWKFSDGQAGINVSGIDAVNGSLALWGIGTVFAGKVGHWDAMANQSLGQVQGSGRLVREFRDSKTFDAHWQDLQKGSFVDVKDSSYSATRID